MFAVYYLKKEAYKRVTKFTWESETTLLSSLMDSSTISLLGLLFCFKIAVANSSLLKLL